jgi:hypothetical protein
VEAEATLAPYVPARVDRHFPETSKEFLSLRPLSSSVSPGEPYEPTVRDAWTLRLIVSFLCLSLATAGGSFFALTLRGLLAPVIAWVDGWGVPAIQPHILTAFVLALGAATVWTALDRTRRWERGIYQFGQLVARLTLVHTMLHFGVWKLFPRFIGPPAQLWPPMPEDLISTFGEFPTFFWGFGWAGAAPTYAVFTGIVEVVAAVLVTFHRSAVLGALLNLAALANIAIMFGDFRSDQPFLGGRGAASFWTSGRYLFATAFILYDQWPRLRAYFFRNEDEIPESRAFAWRRSWARVAVYGWFSIAVIAEWVYFIHPWTNVVVWAHQYERWSTDAVYRVERFAKNGSPLPEGNAGDRWLRVGVIRCAATVRTVDQQMHSVLLLAGDSHPGFEECRNLPPEWSFAGPWWVTEFVGVPRVEHVGPANVYTDTAQVTFPEPDVMRIALRHGADSIVADARRIPDERITLLDPRWFWMLDSRRPLSQYLPPPAVFVNLYMGMR